MKRARDSAIADFAVPADTDRGLYVEATRGNAGLEQALFEAAQDSLNTQRCGVLRHSNGNVALFMNAGSSTPWLNRQVAKPGARRIKAFIGRRGTNAITCVDGETPVVTAKGGNSWPAPNLLYFGTDQDGVASANGLIERVLAFRGAMTETQIQALMR